MIKRVLKHNWGYLLVIFIIILFFNMIINSSFYSKIISFDNTFILSIQNIRTDSLNIFFKIMTYFGEVYIPCVILVYLLVHKENKWIFKIQCFSYAFAGVITYLAKILIARPRPLLALIEIPSSYSFPSGHTLTSIVFYIMLVYLLSFKSKKETRNALVLLATIFALLISFSRPYLGVHYLSDIFGGIILSIPILLMLINIVNKDFKRRLSRK